MSKFDSSHIQWQEPWRGYLPGDAAKAEAEISRELCAGHVLFGCCVTALGYRQDCDDVLFFLGESAPSFAVVHLSYQRETSPEWPNTILFDTFSMWVEQRLIPDAAEVADFQPID